jgi:hypothetical protein
MLLADVTGDATVALAALTFVLAFVGIRSLQLTRDALGAAQADSVEATKTRIDQQAPRVTIVVLGPGSVTGDWAVDHGPSLVRVPGNESISHDFGVMGLSGWFRIFNEGRSTAIVGIPPGVIERRGEIGVTTVEEVSELRPTTQLILEPGQSSVLFVWSARSVVEWIDELNLPLGERTPLRVGISVEDTYSDGISDMTDLLLRGIPLVDSGGAQMTPAQQTISLHVDRTRRTYPNLAIHSHLPEQTQLSSPISPPCRKSFPTWG